MAGTADRNEHATEVAPHMQRLYIFTIIIAQLAGLVSSPLSARAAAAVAAAAPLQIGYLVDGSDFIPTTDDPFVGLSFGEQLRTYLLSRKPLVEAMERAGMSGIVMTPISGSTEMLQSMRSGDLHLVLTTAVTYGRFRQIAANNPGGFNYDYEPILQSRRPGDIGAGRGSGVLRRGIVIMGQSSPLFGRDKLTPNELRPALAGSPIAVPSLDSAAGYLFPMLTLTAQYGISRPGRLLFCGSDSEVVSHVVAGLAPFGACREGAVAATLAANNHVSSESLRRYCRVLFQTAPFPTDPILIRNDLLPSRTDIGREIKPALREFFNEVQHNDRDLRVEDAVPRDYERIQRALEQTAAPTRSVQQITTGTPTRSAQPTPTVVPTQPAAQPTTITTTTRPRPALPNMQ